MVTGPGKSHFQGLWQQRPSKEESGGEEVGKSEDTQFCWDRDRQSGRQGQKTHCHVQGQTGTLSHVGMKQGPPCGIGILHTWGPTAAFVKYRHPLDVVLLGTDWPRVPGSPHQCDRDLSGMKTGHRKPVLGPMCRL